MVKIRFAVMLKVLVTDGFDIVAVGIEHEGAVIIGMIMRPEPRRAVVAAARRHRRRVEGIDQCTGIGGEGDMSPLADSLIVADPEIGLAVRPEAISGPA